MQCHEAKETRGKEENKADNWNNVTSLSEKKGSQIIQ